MKIGRKLRGGETVELIGDLGAGKTLFVRGLAEGMGSKDRVHSPSFTLSNRYRAGELTLNHFDFYRLKEPGLIRHELAEALEDAKTVVVVEWPNSVRGVLPAERLVIRIKPTGENSRRFNFSYPENLKYLIPQDA